MYRGAPRSGAICNRTRKEEFWGFQIPLFSYGLDCKSSPIKVYSPIKTLNFQHSTLNFQLTATHIPASTRFPNATGSSTFQLKANN